MIGPEDKEEKDETFVGESDPVEVQVHEVEDDSERKRRIRESDGA